MVEDFDYDSIPVGYYDSIYHKRSGVQSKWHHLKFEFFLDQLRKEDRVLDIGCGPGTFLGNYTCEQSAVGVDISKQQIDYASDKYDRDQLDFCVFSGTALPFEDNSFDVVVLIEVVEHISVSTVNKLFSEARRVLRPNGRLYVSTPNYQSMWPALEYILNRRAEVSYEMQHINCYRPARLRAEIQQAGFNVTSVRPYQFLAPFFAALSWDLADRFFRFEKSHLSKWLGFLLFAEGVKPKDRSS
ncbi:class I SAM-dependent methyltransferase [Coraliomargarita sp. W4R53]